MTSTLPTSPPGTASSAMPGPDDITRVVLDNGLIVLIRENHAAPVVVINGYLPTGSIHDPAGKGGLASFVASMVTRGSALYDFDTFNETIEGVGASLGVGADDHTTGFGTASLSEDFPTLLQVLADVLRHPTFPAAHLPRVRSQKLVHIQERDEDTQALAGLRFYQTLFGDHPYGRATIGEAASVAAISRTDLEAFHAQRYSPNGAIMVVVGDIETQAALDLIQRHFSSWQGAAPDQTVPAVAPLTGVTRLDLPLPGKVQADIMIGGMAVPRLHPDYFAIRIANTILGRFGMMGRLGQQVREAEGLAYYVYSSQDVRPFTGTWHAAAGVNPVHVEQAIVAIQAEFARLRDEPVMDAELADTQAYLTGVLPLQLETNEGVAATLLSMEWYGLGLDYLQHYNALTYAITPADVQRVAQTYLRPEAYALIVAGPPSA